MRKILEERIRISEAVQIVSKMISCYPNGGQTAARSYIGAVAAVIIVYPAMIARKSKDPVLGVPSECRFLPTPADVIAWCERETAELRRPVDHADRYSEAARQMGAQRDEANYWEKARLQRPTLDEMKAHYGSNWGITQPKQRAAKVYVPLTDDELRARYGKRHDEPEPGIEF